MQDSYINIQRGQGYDGGHTGSSRSSKEMPDLAWGGESLGRLPREGGNTKLGLG